MTNVSGLGVLNPEIVSCAIAGDFDNDGFRDLFVSCIPPSSNFLFRNNGDGTFVDITLSANIPLDTAFSIGASLGDYNLDGYLDIYVFNYIEACTQNTLLRSGVNILYKNNGNLTFTDVTMQYGLVDTIAYTLACAWTDFDNDHDVDLMVVNDFQYEINTTDNLLYRNEYPLDSISNASIATNFFQPVNSMGIAIGDYAVSYTHLRAHETR